MVHRSKTAAGGRRATAEVDYVTAPTEGFNAEAAESAEIFQSLSLRSSTFSAFLLSLGAVPRTVYGSWKKGDFQAMSIAKFREISRVFWPLCFQTTLLRAARFVRDFHPCRERCWSLAGSAFPNRAWQREAAGCHWLRQCFFAGCHWLGQCFSPTARLTVNSIDQQCDLKRFFEECSPKSFDEKLFPGDHKQYNAALQELLPARFRMSCSI